MSSRADILVTIIFLGLAFGLIVAPRYIESRKDASKVLKRISAWASFGLSLFLLVPFGALFILAHDSVRPCIPNQFDLFCGETPHSVILPTIWFAVSGCVSVFLLSKAIHTKRRA